MNTLLLSLLLLTPTNIALEKQIKQQTTQTMKALNTTQKLQLKAQIATTLQKAEPVFSIKVDKNTLAKVHNKEQPRTQE